MLVLYSCYPRFMDEKPGTRTNFTKEQKENRAQKHINSEWQGRESNRETRCFCLCSWPLLGMEGGERTERYRLRPWEAHSPCRCFRVRTQTPSCFLSFSAVLGASFWNWREIYPAWRPPTMQLFLSSWTCHCVHSWLDHKCWRNDLPRQKKRASKKSLR